MKTLYISFLLMLFFQSAVSQQQTYMLGYNNVPAEEVLAGWENIFELRFSYQNDLLQGKKFSCRQKKYDFEEISDLFEKQLQVKFLKVAEHYYIVLGLQTHLWQQQALKEVLVKAYLTQGIAKYKDGSYRLSLDNLGILPGLTEPDVLESLQQLPGVISTDETATNFHIRAGNSDQNAIYWDGIPIYQNGHFFGMISPFNPYTIDKVKYYYKGTPAGFEGGASGVIDLLLSDKIPDSTSLQLGVNGLSADVSLKTPLKKNKLGLLFSFRNSYRDYWRSPTLKSYEDKVLYHTNIVNNNTLLKAFGFNDVSLKLNFHPRKDWQFSTSFIHIFSNLDLDNQYQNLPDYKYDDRLQSTTNGFKFDVHKRFTKKLSWDSKLTVSQYDLIFKDLSYKQSQLTGLIYKENFVSHTTFDTHFIYYLKGRNRLETGYQYTEKRTAYFFKLDVNDEVYVFDYFKTSLNTHALYAQFRYRDTGFLNIDAGIRLNYEKETRKVYWEPRFVLSKTILPYLDWQFTGEIKHQNIQQYTKTVIGLLNLENKIWYAANSREFPVVKAQQLTSGLIYNRHKWIVELDLYVKKLNNITLAVPYRIYDNYEYEVGQEIINGADFFVTKDYKPFKIWLSYGFMNADYRFSSLKNNRLFTSDNEVKNRFASAITYYTEKFKATLGWFSHAPQVYYNDIVNTDENGADIEENNFKNDFRIESLSRYNRLDFSLLYDWKFSKKKQHKIRMGFSVRNLLNNDNHLSTETNSYSLDTSLQNFDRFGLSRTYNFALRYYWN